MIIFHLFQDNHLRTFKPISQFSFTSYEKNTRLTFLFYKSDTRSNESWNGLSFPPKINNILIKTYTIIISISAQEYLNHEVLNACLS